MAVYKGSVKLNKVVGIRHDLGQYATKVQDILKKDTSLPKTKTSRKAYGSRTTRDGLQKN